MYSVNHSFRNNVRRFFKHVTTKTAPSRGGSAAIVAAILLVFISAGGSTRLFGATTDTYLITLDRATIPALNYSAVTLNVSVGSVTDILVLEDDTTVLPYEYSASSGELSFTTEGDSVRLSLGGPDASTFGGQMTISPLRDGKQFAWSHSMDDNIFLENSIAAFDAFNYRGTIYAIGEHISDTRDENWIFDKINVHQLLAKGWAIGNHTYNHGCYGVDYNAEIVAGYNRISQTIPDSPKPNYIINSFAAPCFDSNYHPYVLQHRDNGTTPVILNESGNDALLRVDPNASNFSNNGQTAKAFNVDMQIGRGNAIELGNSSAAISIINWMSANASSTRHFWYNTFSHDSKEAYLTSVMSHIDSNYGQSGTETIWVAPAEEIYAYLLVRDLINISVSNDNGTGNPPTATPLAPTPTPTPLPPTPTPTPTPGNSSGAGQTIYDNSFAQGWSAGTWGNVSYNEDSASASSARGNFLSVQYSQSWGTMFFTNPQSVDASDYDQLSFWVKAGGNGSTSLRISVMNSSYATSSRVTINNLSSTWQQVTIPFTDFGSLTNIYYLLFDIPQATSALIDIDDIVLGSSNGAPPTNTPIAAATSTPTNTPTNTPVAAATSTPTSLPPTATPTSTPTVPAGAVNGLSIYDDSLASGWGAGSWGNITNNLNNNSPKHSGSASIKLQYNEAWGTYYMVSNQAIDADDHASLSFWVYGNANGNAKLSVSVMNSGYQTSYRANIENLTSTWQYVKIPLTQLGPLTDILYILFDNPDASGQPAIYIDDFVLEDANAGQILAASSLPFEIITESAAPAPVIDGRQTTPLVKESLFLPLLIQ